jgi:hypothetical protein
LAPKNRFSIQITRLTINDDPGNSAFMHTTIPP